MKTSANFAVLPASAKVLSMNFSARGLGDRVGFSKTRKFYLRNALLYRIRESFHPRKFPAIQYVLIPVVENENSLCNNKITKQLMHTPTFSQSNTDQSISPMYLPFHPCPSICSCRVKFYGYIAAVMTRPPPKTISTPHCPHTKCLSIHSTS